MMSIISRISGLPALAGVLATLCAVQPTTAPAETGPAFSGARAMELVQAQCDLGPRPPGSAANKKLRQMIVDLARQNGLDVQTLCFEAVDPLSGEPVEICNVVVSAGPSDGENLWLGAHFDTRPISDKDADPKKRDLPLIGANDGASGTAVLMHLLEIMGETPPPGGVDLLFFDGEDSGAAGSVEGFCLGSRHLAKTCRDFGNPLSRGLPRGLVVLDMVGEKNLRIPMEAYSLVNAPDWTKAVFERAVLLGLPTLVMERGPGVYDDHVPFLEMGIPAVDLIDFDFPQWHTSGDTPDICSPASLESVGMLMVDLIYHP